LAQDHTRVCVSYQCWQAAMLRGSTASAAEVLALSTALQKSWGSLTEAFRALDVRGTGYLTLAAWQDGLGRLGYSPEQAEMFFRTLDRSRMGSLTESTFLQFFNREERLQTDRTSVRPSVVRQRSSPIMQGAEEQLNASHGARSFGAYSPGPSPLRGHAQPLSKSASMSVPMAGHSVPESPGRLLRASQTTLPASARAPSEHRRFSERPSQDQMTHTDSSTRLEERVASLHKSLEGMLQESVKTVAQSLKAEWKDLLLAEQEKFSMRATAIGQALMHEMEGKLRSGVIHDARVEAQAVFKNEVRGLVSCFAVGDEQASGCPLDDQFKELRAGLAHFEQRVVERAAQRLQPNDKLLEAVSLLTRQQAELQKRLTVVEGSSSTTLGSPSRSATPLDVSTNDVAHDIDLTQQLDVTLEASSVALVVEAMELDRSIKSAGSKGDGCASWSVGDKKQGPQGTQKVDQMMEVLCCEFRGELDSQRSQLNSLSSSLEKLSDKKPLLHARSASSQWVKKQSASPQLSDDLDDSSLSGSRHLDNTEVLDMLDVLRHEVMKLRAAKALQAGGPGRTQAAGLQTWAEEDVA